MIKNSNYLRLQYGAIQTEKWLVSEVKHHLYQARAKQ